MISLCAGCARPVAVVESPLASASAMASDSIECTRVHARRVAWLLEIARTTLRTRGSIATGLYSIDGDPARSWSDPGEEYSTRDVARALALAPGDVCEIGDDLYAIYVERVS